MTNWTDRDWEIFFKALSPAIAAMGKEYFPITDKSVIGMYAFKIAYAVVYEARLAKNAPVIFADPPINPKNFGND